MPVRISFNLFVLLFNLGLIPPIIHAISLFLLETDTISQQLADGMIIASCLPMTNTLVVELTKKCSGDVACA